MIYIFELQTMASLAQAFSESTLIREREVVGKERRWDYIFCQFKAPVDVSFPLENNDLITSIFKGDALLNQLCEKQFSTDLKVEAGLRWVGDIEGERKIEIKGLAIKISCHVNYSSFAVQEVIDYLLRVLVTYGLLKEDSILKLNNTLNIASSPPSQVALPPQKTPAFFDKRVIAKEARSKLKETISQDIKSILPKYRRGNENGINPVYRKIGDIHQSLHLNEKYIWLLTGDGLATGIKNSYAISFGDRTLFDAIDEKLHPYVNWDDRYGHPSIAIPHEHYDGSALYGGYVCQRQGYLQVFTSSGRYYRDDLTLEQKRKLEAYVSWKLMNAFGEQAILFQEGPYLDYFELSLFYANKPLPPEIQTRKYTLADIKAIFNEGIESKHNQYSISQLFKDDQLFNRFVEGLREEGMVQSWNWTV